MSGKAGPPGHDGKVAANSMRRTRPARCGAAAAAAAREDKSNNITWSRDRSRARHRPAGVCLRPFITFLYDENCVITCRRRRQISEKISRHRHCHNINRQSVVVFQPPTHAAALCYIAIADKSTSDTYHHIAQCQRDRVDVV